MRDVWGRALRVVTTASFRLAGMYLGLFVVSALVLGAAIFMSARSAINEQLADRIDGETAFLIREYKAHDLPYLIDLISSRGRGITTLDYVLRAPDGAPLAGEIPATAAEHPGWITVDVQEGPADGMKLVEVTARVTDIGDGYMLAVGDGLDGRNEVQEAIARALTVTLGLAILLGIAGGILISRAFLARVDVISRTAEAIIGGDLAQRVPVRGTGDDLDRLAATLNRMLDRITSLMESVRQVSTDVAHDLRTPLSRLYQKLEGARRQATSVQAYEAAIDGAIAEAEGLLETFSALLRIAQVEGASPRDGFRDVDLSAIVENVMDAYQLDAEAGGHKLLMEIASDVHIHGDAELLTQALSNLIENALRHTPAGTLIDLGLWREAADVVLVVADNGPGVAAKDLPRLVNRFYRAEQSRTTPGNGLGLSLVAAIVELHGANLDLSPARPGLRVAIRFSPVQKA